MPEKIVQHVPAGCVLSNVRGKFWPRIASISRSEPSALLWPSVAISYRSAHIL